jgi:hypothetical protein
MVSQQKTQRWQEAEAWGHRVKDALGTPLDAGIRDLVIALHALDIQTLASCEGHLDHGDAAPWVNIGARHPQAKQAYLALHAAHQEPDPTQRRVLLEQVEAMKLEGKRAHLIECRKVLALLERFYASRSVPAEVRLLLQSSEWSGIMSLESQGAAYQDCIEEDERARCLVLYQQEMQAFATFLIQNVLTELEAD